MEVVSNFQRVFTFGHSREVGGEKFPRRLVFIKVPDQVNEAGFGHSTTRLSENASHSSTVSGRAVAITP